MIEKILSIIFGSKQERDLKGLIPIVRKINSYEPAMLALADSDFRLKTTGFKERIAKGETLDQILPEAFALAREAARRVLGERCFDVQLLGGIVLHQGKIMEMKTGEGKTLSSIPAAYMNSLTGQGVHIVTVNDYLAKRDSEWMGPVYDMLGVSVGVILSDMDYKERKIAYGRDITYGTNNEFGFDYLRDNLKWESAEKTQRVFNYCIVDEIDSILIDEARTPLIISGPAEDDTRFYYDVNRLVESLRECDKDPETEAYPDENLVGDYKIDEKRKHISFTDEGMNSIERVLMSKGIIKSSLFSSENFEYIHYFTQCLKAHKLFHIDVDYVVNDGKVEIVDEFTGRILHGRRYSDGLHQAIEAKERIKIEQRNRTLATITFQNYFRMYKKISGMTGTADTEASEFAKIYSLEVVVVPTNRPVVRDDDNDVIFLTEEDKLKSICEDIKECNKIGQPVLVGTVSIEKSELLASLLTRIGVRHEILNAKNHAREALIIAEAGAKGAVTIATNMAGRGTDIKLGGNPEYRARRKAGTDAARDMYEKIYEDEYRKWLKDYEEVKGVGGLYVLGTERHEARRIDNQLRGRSGRQGDPGKSCFYISMDDELMRLFGGENLKNLLGKVGMKDGEPINHPWINKSIERAQKKVEDRNFEVRKHLLEFDDVLNEQRKYIYSRRDEILDDTDLLARIMSTAAEIVREYISSFAQADDRGLTAVTRLISDVRDTFFFTLSRSPDALKDLKPDELESTIIEELKQELLKKESQLGNDNLNKFIKSEYLHSIDTRWQDHLESLEALREAVYLRTYSQKNPLLEYKLEGFSIFDEMIQNIRSVIARKIFKVQIHAVDGVNLVLERTTTGSAMHRVLGQFAGSSTNQRSESQPLKVQVKRSQPKVGRNDPCPCGSGRKYKFCHGK